MENVGAHDSVSDNTTRHRQPTPSDEMRSISPDTPPSASRWKTPSPIVPAHYPSGQKKDVVHLAGPKHALVSQLTHPHHPTSNSPENSPENQSSMPATTENRKAESSPEQNQNPESQPITMGSSSATKTNPVSNGNSKSGQFEQPMMVNDMSSSDISPNDPARHSHHEQPDPIADVSGRQSVAKEARRYQSLQDVVSTLASSASREGQSSTDPPRTPQTGTKLRTWHKRGIRNKADKDSDAPKMDKQTKQFMEAQLLRSKTEIPYPLQMSIYEEVYPIVLRSVETYSAELGHDHQVTVAAIQRLQDLARLLRRKSEY